ncbi:MAG: TetR/AcrR family transcriptional regulator [Streptosporangiaceae bacterium]
MPDLGLPGAGATPRAAAPADGTERQRLVEGFVAVAAERGYPETTIFQVIEAAGVTKKSFYHHFDSLEECFVSAYEQGAARIAALMLTAHEAHEDRAEGVGAALGVLLEVLAAERPFTRLAFVEVNAAGPAVRAVRARCLASLVEFLGRYGASAEILEASVGGVYSSIWLRAEAGRLDSLPALLPSLTQFVLVSINRKENDVTQ